MLRKRPGQKTGRLWQMAEGRLLPPVVSFLDLLKIKLIFNFKKMVIGIQSKSKSKIQFGLYRFVYYHVDYQALSYTYTHRITELEI